ncbi:MAG: hypothetical protein FJ280_07070 [Planctomycetes bacterium]|nr:hypothetical protein [Planctomycetota bacterium]
MKARSAWHVAGYAVTVLALVCQDCGRINLCAVEGAAVQSGRRRVLLRPPGPVPWPVLVCARCESRRLLLVEDL